MLNSIELNEEIKKQLSELSESMDSLYYRIKEEISSEYKISQELNKEKLKETNRVYELLTTESCLKLLKKYLPVRVKLFNKINVRGFGVYTYYRSNEIVIYYYFNNNVNNHFQFVINVEAVKKDLRMS